MVPPPEPPSRRPTLLPLSPVRIPGVLRARVERYQEDFLRALEEHGLAEPSADLGPALPYLWAYSDFLAQAAVRQPDLILSLWESGDATRPYRPDEYAQRLKQSLSGIPNEPELARALRRFRQREMVRIGWRDLAGWSPLEETMLELSWLAEAVLEASLERLYLWFSQEWGRPMGESGKEQQLVVVALGKLGAWELNFSSDVDLVFAYPEEGETVGGARPLTVHEFFTRLGQHLVQLLSTPSPEGRVFRMDMRLRPFGDSGPLVTGFDAMESYYQTHGRDWERYAWVKARPVAGDRRAGEQLMSILRPFVYRRYFDYGAFESLRQMKQLIRQEVRRKGLEGNIKLGAGGIREIEFTAQVFQLVRGGRVPQLREQRLLRVLQLLASRGHLPPSACRELADAYVFLRMVEHRLQEAGDQQTHELPEDEVLRAQLACSLGFVDWAAFRQVLDGHRARVQRHFEQVFVDPQGGTPAQKEGRPAAAFAAIWAGSLEGQDAVDALESAGFLPPEESLESLVRLRESHSVRSLSETGRERLGVLVPLLMDVCTRLPTPRAALTRVLTVVETVAQRTAYLALLVESSLALSHLVKLCAASPWITRLVALHPILLDDLLDPRSLYAPVQRDELSRELRDDLEGVAFDDLEQQMEVLRHFKQSQVLSVAAADVMGLLPLAKVSDHLSDVAEIILEQVLTLAWEHTARRHGRPTYGQDGGRKGADFAIVAYGKLGGRELGYGSDLDLVFLHDSMGQNEVTDGESPVDNQLFFSRLAKRIIHILTAHTPSGVLYEVDTRLRPDGGAGLLVSSLNAFEEYQRGQAWTWEHQALIRARAVAGKEGVRSAFSAVRDRVLRQHRERALLREHVCAMRARMQRSLASRDLGYFDLKQDTGGIVDIEFITQFGVLAWAHAEPALTHYTATLPLLEEFARRGLMSPEDTHRLGEAYRAYRGRLHALTLQGDLARVSGDEFAEHRAAVMAVWRGLLTCAASEENPA